MGHELETRFEKQNALRGFELLQRAVELDPGFARAWLVLGWIAWLIVQEKWVDDIEGYRALQREAFTNAAALDPLDTFALMELAAVRSGDGDSTGASDALERALDLGRNQADLLIVASRYVATILDDPDRAIRIMDRGLLLSTRVSVWHRLTAARVCYFAKDFERAAENAKLVPASSAAMTRLFQILALAQLGRTEEVAELVLAFKARYPKFVPQDFMRDHPITAPGAQRLFLDGSKRPPSGEHRRTGPQPVLRRVLPPSRRAFLYFRPTRRHGWRVEPQRVASGLRAPRPERSRRQPDAASCRPPDGLGPRPATANRRTRLRTPVPVCIGRRHRSVAPARSPDAPRGKSTRAPSDRPFDDAEARL